MSAIYQYKSVTSEIKDIDPKSMTVAGYFSSFNKKDAYNEITVKGAFSKSISENFDRIRFLLNHDVTKSLGSFNDLREDDYGLMYHANVLPTSFGKDFMIMVEGGIIKEHSIGYKEVPNRIETVGDTRYLKELQLYEGSALTGWGVNQFTPMIPVMKSAVECENRIKTLEDFCKNTTATDETIQLLLLEIKQLSQLITEIQAAPEKSTQHNAPEKSTHSLHKGLDLERIAQIFIN